MNNSKNKSINIFIWVGAIGTCFGFIVGLTKSPITSSVLSILIPVFFGVVLLYSNRNVDHSKKFDKNQPLSELVHFQLKLVGIFVVSLTLTSFLALLLKFYVFSPNVKDADDSLHNLTQEISIYNKNWSDFQETLIERTSILFDSQRHKSTLESSSESTDSLFNLLMKDLSGFRHEILLKINNENPDKPSEFGYINNFNESKFRGQNSLCTDLENILSILDSNSSKYEITNAIQNHSESLSYFSDLNRILDLDSLELHTILTQFKINLCD